MRALVLLLLSLLAACEVAPWREQPPPWTAATVADVEDARVLLGDGSELVLSGPRLEGEGGEALLLGEGEDGPCRVPLRDVCRLETRRTEVLPVIANAVIVTAVVAGVVVLCACGGGHGGGLDGLNFGGGSAPEKATGCERVPAHRPPGHGRPPR